MLLQPKHILFFKLMGMEFLLSGHGDLFRSLMSLQNFFDSHSRDIVNENDENFSVKFELIYTSGTQGPVELYPERWDMIRLGLQILRTKVLEVQHELPYSIEIEPCPAGYFPRILFTREDA